MMKLRDVLTCGTMALVSSGAYAGTISFDLRDSAPSGGTGQASSLSRTVDGLTATFAAKSIRDARLRQDEIKRATLADGRITQGANGASVTDPWRKGRNAGLTGIDNFFQISFSSLINITSVTFDYFGRSNSFHLFMDASGDGQIGVGDRVSELAGVRRSSAFSGFDGTKTDIFGIGALDSEDNWSLQSVTVNYDAPVQTFQFARFSTDNQRTDPQQTKLQDDINPVPLPAAGWLMVAALGGMGALRRFKRS